MIFVRLIRAAVLVAATCGAAMLATPAKAQQPSADAIATAKEILAAKNSLVMFEPIVPGVIEQVRTVLTQQNPNLQKPLSETAADLRPKLAPKFEELKSEIAKSYAARFTEQELKDLLAFFKSPLGKKSLIEEAKFVEETLTRAQDWSNQLADNVMAQFRAEMKKKGHTL